MCKTLGLIPNIKENNSSHHTQDGYHHHEITNLEMLVRKHGKGMHAYMLLVVIQINITTTEAYVEMPRKQTTAAVALQGI